MLQLVKIYFTKMLIMNEPSLFDVTPTFFLQTFILELMHASEQQGQKTL
jgi:hypothetical protein